MRTDEIAAVIGEFDLGGKFLSAISHPQGHINDTYIVSCDATGRVKQYVLQRINRNVFHNPELQMENIGRVLNHLQARERDPRRVLALVPTRDGAAFCKDNHGEYWRTYVYIENTKTCDVIDTPEQAYQAALSFGRFQNHLADLPEPRLRETIPDFHHTPKRFLAFEKTAADDPLGRSRDAGPEMELAYKHRGLAGVLTGLLERGKVPERVAHNDTKINNVLFDSKTGEGLAVLDLDTVMPGLSLFDFGDLVRGSVSAGAEDDEDLSKVSVRLPIFEGLARGFLEGAGNVLTKPERAHLAVSAKILAYELGLRFLTDFLAGDVYFKTIRPQQNLKRCRTQFRLVGKLIESEGKMSRVVQKLA